MGCSLPHIILDLPIPCTLQFVCHVVKVWEGEEALKYKLPVLGKLPNFRKYFTVCLVQKKSNNISIFRKFYTI